EVGRGPPTRRQRGAGRVGAEIRAGHAVAHNSALANPGPSHDPLVGRGDHAFEIAIAQDARRDGGARGHDASPHRVGSAPLSPKRATLSSISRWMCSFTCPSKNSLATRIEE